MKLQRLNEDTVIIHIGDPADRNAPTTIASTLSALRHYPELRIIDSVAANHSLLLQFASGQIPSLTHLKHLLSTCQESLPASTQLPPVKEIPVLYGGGDLQTVAYRCGLTETEVITMHQTATYEVFAIGFLPGFAYLGPLPEALRLPRQTTPRTRVPAGSLAIAEDRTGVYPRSSPGGWHLIGRVPGSLLTPFSQLQDGDSPCPLSVGQTVKFRAVDEQEYRELGGEVAD